MNIENKLNYQGNGISFDYPAEYKLNQIIGIGGRFLEGIKDSDHTFEISKKVIDSNFDDKVKEIRSSIEEGFTINEERKITIAGATGYQISYSNELIGHTQRTFFDKYDVRYNILTEPDSSLDTLFESFKVLIECNCGAQNNDSNSFCTECGLKLKKSNKITLQKTVDELNQFGMGYGFAISQQNFFFNWQYNKPITVDFSKRYSNTKLDVESDIFPPDIISFDNVYVLSMFDNELTKNLKTDIYFKTFVGDLVDIGSISLKIYDIEFEESEDQDTLHFICDFV